MCGISDGSTRNEQIARLPKVDHEKTEYHLFHTGATGERRKRGTRESRHGENASVHGSPAQEKVLTGFSLLLLSLYCRLLALSYRY